MLPHSAATESVECSTEGSFEITSEGTPTRRIEFNARIASNGTITGQVTLRDVAVATNTNSEGDSPEPFYLTAQVDCLVIKENKALLTGTVTEASSERYMGGRLLLVAVHTGDAGNSPSADRLTWGFYRSLTRDWLAKDSERDDDHVDPIAWIASDSERIEDELKVMSEKNAAVGCDSFPLSVFSVTEENHARGEVKVRP